MASRTQRAKWRDALKAIGPGATNAALPVCPACTQKRLDHLYVGDAATRIGFLVVWCHACLRGIRISRAIAPANVHFMTFDDATDAIAERVPSFTEVQLHP